MNIELDKHDLFRNVVPGYVFLIVIFSFYAVTNRLDSIKQIPMAIIGMIAGFPLGFLISVLYRIIFHSWTFGCSEQKQMEREDTILIRRFADSKETKHIKKWFETAYTKSERIKMKTRAFAYLFDRFLYSHEGKAAFRDRILFLISFIHCLGATSFAIILAILFICLIKLPLWCSLMKYNFSYFCHEFNLQLFYIITLIIFWLLAATALYLGRESYKDSFMAAKRAFFF